MCTCTWSETSQMLPKREWCHPSSDKLTYPKCHAITRRATPRTAHSSSRGATNSSMAGVYQSDHQKKMYPLWHADSALRLEKNPLGLDKRHLEDPGMMLALRSHLVLTTLESICLSCTTRIERNITIWMPMGNFVPLITMLFTHIRYLPILDSKIFGRTWFEKK